MKRTSKVRLAFAGLFLMLSLPGLLSSDPEMTTEGVRSARLGAMMIGVFPAALLLVSEVYYRGRDRALARAAARGETPWDSGPVMFPAALGFLLLALVNLLTPGGVTAALVAGEIVIVLGAATAIYLGLRPPEQCASAGCSCAPLFFRRGRGWHISPNVVVCPKHWPSYQERMTCAGCGTVAPELLFAPGRSIAGSAGFGRCWECRKTWCARCDRKRDEGAFIYYLCPTCGGELSNDLFTEPSR